MRVILLFDVETGVVVGAQGWVSLVVVDAVIPGVEGDGSVGHAPAIP